MIILCLDNFSFARGISRVVFVGIVGCFVLGVEIFVHYTTGTGGMERYLSACGPALGPDNPLTKARLEVWEALSCLPLGAMLLRGATFVHLGTTPELLDMMTLRLKGFVEPYGLTARCGVLCSTEQCNGDLRVDKICPKCCEKVIWMPLNDV